MWRLALGGRLTNAMRVVPRESAEGAEGGLGLGLGVGFDPVENSDGRDVNARDSSSGSPGLA